jgi:hypothetical protein
MSELRRRLDAEAGEVRADPRALDNVLRRAERRRRARGITTAVVALAVAGGTLTLAYAAFTPGRETRPAVPVPGPTASPQAEEPAPPPLRIEVVSGVPGPDAGQAAAALISGLGGIDGRTYVPTWEGEQAREPFATTAIYCPPPLDHAAFELQAELFPGASIRPLFPGGPFDMKVVVGADFERDSQDVIAAASFIEDFMRSRQTRDGQANRMLSDVAADAYHRGVAGLELFGYTDDYQLVALYTGQGLAIHAVVRIVDTDEDVVRWETLGVGDPEPEDGRLEILSAALNDGPSPAPAPTSDQVTAFVEGFLQARHDRSGAGTYLGEDARAAYAAHEQGLDFLGYAAGPGPVDARIVTYDKLSPDRHRVTVRFDATGEDPSVVWETLLIEWLGADGFVVLDAQRGFSRESDPPPPEDPEQAVAGFVLEELDSPYVGTCPEGLGPLGSVPGGICSVRFETGANRVVYRVGPPFSEWLGELELERDETGLWSVTRYEPFPPPGG